MRSPFRFSRSASARRFRAFVTTPSTVVKKKKEHQQGLSIKEILSYISTAVILVVFEIFVRTYKRRAVLKLRYYTQQDIIQSKRTLQSKRS